MKKLVLVIIAALTFSGLSAQEIGVRFGGVAGSGGAAVDAVFGVGESRIHADLGFYNQSVGVDVLWDLLYRPLGGEAFNWYAGVGFSSVIGDPFCLGPAGEIGLEYRFNTVPIVIGFDWRPTLWLVNETQFGADSFGLNVRWNFSE